MRELRSVILKRNKKTKKKKQKQKKAYTTSLNIIYSLNKQQPANAVTDYV